MSVKLIDNIRHYQGLSTDTKPSDSTILAGSRFFEEDTSIEYRYDGTAWVVDATNPGMLSTLNSTDSSLMADGVFTGTMEDISNVAVIIVTVLTDEPSATDGLSVQYSADGVNWDVKDEFTIPANTGKTFSFQPSGMYFRVVYTNGSSLQMVFRLNTFLKTTYVKPSSHRVEESISGEDDAELVKAVLTGEDSSTTGVFNNVKTTVDGNLRVVDAGSGLAISKGEVQGTTFVHKFGNAPDFDTTDGIITVWDGADDSDINQMIYQYSSTADIDTISSSDNGDTQDIELNGLDTDYNLVTQTVQLLGQTAVPLTTPLVRLFRMKNVNSSDNAGYVYGYVSTAISGGVPTDSTKVRAVIQPGANQTLMAVYTIPAGKTGYLRDFFGAVAGANKTSNYILDVRVRPFGEVFQLKHRTSLSDNGTSYIQHKYESPEDLSEKTDIEIQVSLTAAGVSEASFSAGFDLDIVDN